MVLSGQNAALGSETPVTWKEWLEEKKTTEQSFPARQSCNHYALISRYPEVLAMFREAMKQQGNRSDKCNNITQVGNGKGTGTSRAYSVTRVQQECKL